MRALTEVLRDTKENMLAFGIIEEEVETLCKLISDVPPCLKNYAYPRSSFQQNPGLHGRPQNRIGFWPG